MNKLYAPLALGLAAVLLAPAATAQQAGKDKAKKLYCWNEGGRKVCGDALPATAVDSVFSNASKSWSEDASVSDHPLASSPSTLRSRISANRTSLSAPPSKESIIFAT